MFLQSPQTLRAGWMPRSTAPADALAARAPAAGRALGDLLGVAVLAVIARSTWPALVRDWERGAFVGTLGDFAAPTSPMKAAIGAGGTVAAPQFAARIWRRYRAIG